MHVFGRLTGHPTRQVLAAAAVCATAAGLGAAVGLGEWTIIALLMAVAMAACGARWPVIGLLALVLLTTEVFGLIANVKSLRVGGVIDSTLGAVALSCVFVLGGRARLAWQRLSRDERIVAWLLLAVVALAVFRALGTSFEYGISVYATLAAARRYAMYLVVAGVVALGTRGDANTSLGARTGSQRLSDAFLGIAALYSLAVVVIWMSGIAGSIPGLRLVTDDGSVRAYPAASFLCMGGASMAFAYLADQGRRLAHPSAALAAILCSTAVLTTGSRAALAALAVSAVVVFGLKSSHYRGRGTRLTALLIVLVGVAYGFMAIGFGGRFGTIAQELVGNGGTGGWRLAESQFRLALVAASPVWGVGFIPYDLSSGFTQGWMGITHLETVDSGLVTLLVNFGALGVIWLVALLVALWRAGRRRMRLPQSSTAWRACLGYLAGGALTIPTQGHFTMSQGIATSALMIGLALAESSSSTPPSAGGGD